MDTYSLYAGQLLPFAERFVPKGHSACAGCGIALAVRHVCKALENTPADIDTARWQVPWHPAGAPAMQPSLLSIPKTGADPAGSLDICFDNEVPEKKLDTAALFKKQTGIAAAAGSSYAATACPSHPFDLIEKVTRAWNANGSAYLHILCPCPIAWGFAPEFTVKVGRAAIESRLFPLYEITDGYYRFTSSVPNPRPITQYLRMQERFDGIRGKKADTLQAEVVQAYSALIEKTKIGM